MTITDVVRKRLQETGWSQVEIARRSGVTQAMVSKFLSGSGVHSKTLDAFARVAGARIEPKQAQIPSKRKIIREKV